MTLVKPLTPKERMDILCHVFGVDSPDDLPKVSDEEYTPPMECVLPENRHLPNGMSFDRIFVDHYREIGSIALTFSWGDILRPYEMSYTLDVDNISPKKKELGDPIFAHKTESTKGKKNSSTEKMVYSNCGIPSSVSNDPKVLQIIDSYFSLCQDLPRESIVPIPEEHPVNQGAQFFPYSNPTSQPDPKERVDCRTMS